VRIKLAWLFIGFFAALLSLQSVSAQDLFYTGEIIVESMVINVDIGDVALLHAEYQLINAGESREEVLLGFVEPGTLITVDGKDLEGRIVFDPGEIKTINLSCNLAIIGETTKSLLFDPNMLFDDKPSAMPIGSIQIDVLLPEGVNQLAWASQMPREENFESGKKSYSWFGVDQYATQLALKWSTLDVNLSIEKSINPDTVNDYGQRIEVKIKLLNNGTSSLEKIQLVDQYSLSNFEGIEPENEFSKENNVLFWVTAIDSLDPGEEKTITYILKHIGYIPPDHVLEIKPCSVYIDGNLVGVSNTARLKQGGESGLPETDPEGLQVIEESKGFCFPSIPVIGGILIGLIAIAVVTIILVKKKRSKKKTDQQAIIRKGEINGEDN
jgi:hypothetical protein